MIAVEEKSAEVKRADRSTGEQSIGVYITWDRRIEEKGNDLRGSGSSTLLTLLPGG